MSRLLYSDIHAVKEVVDEAMTISNAIYKHIDDLGFVDDENGNTISREFIQEDVDAICNMSRAIGRLLVIVDDSLEEIYDVLHKFALFAPDDSKLKSVVFDKLYRGL